MTIDEKKNKLETLPLFALYDLAIRKGIAENEINGKDKSNVVGKILISGLVKDEEIDALVNDYIYGDRVTFTLWSFTKPLAENDYKVIKELRAVDSDALTNNEFRNVRFISLKEFKSRFELVYVYSKAYVFVNEEGNHSKVWEQHRGCIWLGKEPTYLASISRHKRIAELVIEFVANQINNSVMQIKPPKAAIDKCTDIKAISRVVLQGIEGEKTVISKVGGITYEQEEEINRILPSRINMSGSLIAAITEDVEATVKYNIKTGSIGINKHLPADVLFEWSENTIKTIFEEIEALKGRPAEEIFRELGQEINWQGICKNEYPFLNWFLTQVISSIDRGEFGITIPIEIQKKLDKTDLFTKFPRIYCETCDTYEIPKCSVCGKNLVFGKSNYCRCECGAPLELVCDEGHRSCEIVNWYYPTDKLLAMINKNIRKIYTKYNKSNHNLMIFGDMLYLSNLSDEYDDGTEIKFEDVKCFQFETIEISQEIKKFAVNMKEKCDTGTCSYAKIERCIKNHKMVCLPKLFYGVVPSFRPQPHKGMEYGDISGEIKVGMRSYEFKGIIKKNSENSARKTVDDDVKIQKLLLSTSKEGEEIIRQFIEQGLTDTRCQVIAVIAPQYFDASFKGTLRFLARLGGKKVLFIGLDEVAKLVAYNETIDVE